MTRSHIACLVACIFMLAGCSETVVGPGKAGNLTVTYEMNDQETGVIATASVSTDSILDLLVESPVSREGYVFAGWSYDRQGIEVAQNGDGVANNITLYARWDNAVDLAESVTLGEYDADAIARAVFDDEVNNESYLSATFEKRYSNGSATITVLYGVEGYTRSALTERYWFGTETIGDYRCEVVPGTIYEGTKLYLEYNSGVADIDKNIGEGITTIKPALAGYPLFELDGARIEYAEDREAYINYLLAEGIGVIPITRYGKYELEVASGITSELSAGTYKLVAWERIK